MLWRFTPILFLLAVFHPAPLAANSILDELTLVDPNGDRTTLALTLDAAGNSIYTFVAPDSGSQASTPPVVDLTAGLLDLILSLDGNSANLAPLFAPGAVFAELTPDFTPVLTSAVSSATGSVSSSTTISSAVVSPSTLTTATSLAESNVASSAPEPATLSLAGGLGLILAAYALSKARRLRKASCHIRGKPHRHGPL